MAFQNELYNFALSLADAAADISRSYFRDDASINRKSENNVVTKVDSDIESTLRELIRDKYPEHSIISEEYSSVGVNKESEYSWVINPIDGLTAFALGKPTFTTLITLVKKDKPILGIIDQPIMEERYVGIIDDTSYKLSLDRLSLQKVNNTDWYQVIKASSIKDLSRAKLNVINPDTFSQEELILINKLKREVEVCSWGGDGYTYALLANGYIDIVMESQLKYPDVAALIPVVTASGGIISTWQGDPITPDFNGQCLACSNKELHTQVLRLINS